MEALELTLSVLSHLTDGSQRYISTPDCPHLYCGAIEDDENFSFYEPAPS